VLPTRLEWAAGLIDRAEGFIPEYGSPEFEALPDDSPEKVASCVRAAEAWRVYFSPEEIGRRLRAELEAAHLADDEPPMWSKDVVDAVHRTANRPSLAELSNRRGEPDRAERANDHRRRMGLPVDERPSTSCKDTEHDWALFAITTDWPQDAERPQQWRCRRCLLFGRRAPALRVVRDA
jgi:hypothetical protein